MIGISNKDSNHLAKIVRLKGLRKHENADRLQVVDIDFQPVITGLEAKDGNVYVFFPAGSKINKDFLSHINGFRNNILNKNPEKVGFFDENCRVREIKLRGEISTGFIVPITELVTFLGRSFRDLDDLVGEEFDIINNIQLVEKYKIPGRQQGSGKDKLSTKKTKVSRIIDGQVNLHVNTEQLGKNAYKIKPDDIISLSYKTHGTSWWTGNVPVKRPLSWFEKALKWAGVDINTQEYDFIYGSRKVIKNEELNPTTKKGHYFGYDLWKDIMERVKPFVPKNYTLYGECLGYDKNGRMIQKDYDYGCSEGQFKLEVYRITVTNPDGLVTELTTPEIIEFCNKAGLNHSHYFYYGPAREVVEEKGIEIKDDRDFTDNFVRILKETYNEKDCFKCINSVPEEGIVVRKESVFAFNAFKLKSFRFLEYETKQAEAGEEDMESEN